MKAALSFLIGICLFATLAFQLAAKRPSAVANSYDADYVSALAAADLFFHAWQNHDQETGLLLLSNAAKRHTSAEQIEMFFSASQAAYEITLGKKLGSGRYTFSVALFETSGNRRRNRRYSKIVVVRAGKNDWAIDNLP